MFSDWQKNILISITQVLSRNRAACFMAIDKGVLGESLLLACVEYDLVLFHEDDHFLHRLLHYQVLLVIHSA